MGTVSAIVSQNRDLARVLRNPGFRAVAAAVRASTVGAQADRSRGPTIAKSGTVSSRNSGVRLLWGGITFWRTSSPSSPHSIKKQAAGVRAMRIQDRELEAFRSQAEHLAPDVPV